MATILQAIDLPKAGGDTLFADCVLAYERLSEHTQNKIVDLMGIHRAHGITDPAKYSPVLLTKALGLEPQFHTPWWAATLIQKRNICT